MRLGKRGTVWSVSKSEARKRSKKKKKLLPDLPTKNEDKPDPIIDENAKSNKVSDENDDEC